jgi:hypothetical protein
VKSLKGEKRLEKDLGKEGLKSEDGWKERRAPNLALHLFQTIF